MKGKYSITVHTPGGDVVRHFDDPGWMTMTLNCHPEYRVDGSPLLERTLRNEWAVYTAMMQWVVDRQRRDEEREAKRAARRPVGWKPYTGPPLAPGDPRHGVNGYQNYDCRCVICTDAHAVDYGLRRDQPRTLEPGDERHGTDNAYHYWHCKCVDCLAAHAIAHRPSRLVSA